MRNFTKLTIALGALAFTLLSQGSASAETTWGVSVNLGNAPPPPVVVVREEPRLVLVPGSTVRIVEDDRYAYDCFQLGGYWYACNGGYWYRSRAWRGPFAVVESRSVPRAILNVPARHWKHHPHGGPPGLAKRQRGREVTVVNTRPSQVVVVKDRHDKGGGKHHH